MYRFIRLVRVPFVTLAGLFSQYLFWNSYYTIQHFDSAVMWIPIVSGLIVITYIIAQLTRDCSPHNKELDD